MEEGIVNVGIINGYSNAAEKKEMDEILNNVQTTAKSIIDLLHSSLQLLNGNFIKKNFIENVNNIKNEVEKLVTIINNSMKSVAKSHVFIYILAYSFQESRQTSIKFLNFSRKVFSTEEDYKPHVQELNLLASQVNYTTSLLLSISKELNAIPSLILQICNTKKRIFLYFFFNIYVHSLVKIFLLWLFLLIIFGNENKLLKTIFIFKILNKY